MNDLAHLMELTIDYELADVEQLARRYPDGYALPPPQLRMSLQPGMLVKLIFSITDPRPGELSGERMWVRLTHAAGPHYVGHLCNVPTAIRSVGLGSRIEFGPQHVVDIDLECR